MSVKRFNFETSVESAEFSPYERKLESTNSYKT